MKKYKVIFLDWNGTLSSSKFWGHLENEGYPNSYLFPIIENSLFGNLRHLINPWMRGIKTSEEIINEISADSKLDYDLIFREFVIGCKKMKLVSHEVEKMINFFRKKGIKMIIATDNMDSFSRWTVPSLKLKNLFDNILDSFTLKNLKNDFANDGESMFFRKFMSKNKIKKGESIIIDDSEDKENRIQNYGIDYFKIESHTGLLGALDKLASKL